jgi:hypothetical protein
MLGDHAMARATQTAFGKTFGSRAMRPGRDVVP